MGRVENQANPLFINNGRATMTAGGAAGGGAGGASSLSADALERQVDLPSAELWQVYRAEFLQMQRSLASAQASLSAAKKAAALSEEGLGGGAAGAAGAGSGVARHKAEFRPTGAAGAMVSRAATGAKSLKALRKAADV